MSRQKRSANLIVNMSGGLGNQLFQYSFGQHLRARHADCEILYDHRDLIARNATHFDSNLNGLNLEINPFTVHDDSYKFLLTFTARQRTLFRENIISSKHIILEERYCDKHPQPHYYLGYWQDQKYASAIKSDIENRVYNYFNLNMKNFPFNYNGFAIHIRRGDYLNSTNTNIYHQYSIEYYRDFILQHVSEERPIYIFSDDLPLIKRQLTGVSRYVNFVENPNFSVLDEFVLMSRFKNILVSNSTFSWWAAYLESQNKSIFQLPYWFKNERTPLGLVL